MEGEYSKSAQELELAVNLSGGTFYYIALLGIAYSKMGKLQEIQKLLDTIEARTTDVYTSYFPKAMLLSELGEKEEALSCLQKAYEERMELLRTLKYVDRFSFSNLRSDPRFVDIVDKVWRESE
jgi:tetratricopeptide (TPR) repeat protein